MLCTWISFCFGIDKMLNMQLSRERERERGKEREKERDMELGKTILSGNSIIQCVYVINIWFILLLYVAIIDTSLLYLHSKKILHVGASAENEKQIMVIFRMHKKLCGIYYQI